MSSSTRTSSSRNAWTQRKRSAAAAEAPLDTEALIEQQALEIERLKFALAEYEAPLVVKSVPGMYNMDRYEDTLLLADALWQGNLMGSMTGLREANPQFVGVLAAKLKNNYHPAPHLKLQAGLTKARLLDGILSCVPHAIIGGAMQTQTSRS